MRVLGIFSSDTILGGGEISFTLSLQGLKNSGAEVLAVLPGEGSLAHYLTSRNIRCEIAAQPTFRRGGSIQFLLRAHPVLRGIASRFRPDVIHCNAIRSALYGQAVGRALSIPTLFHARTAQQDPPFDQFLMATTAGIICTSQVVRERFFGWLDAGRMTVIPNPIDPSFLEEPTDQHKRLRSEWLGGESDGVLIGVVGRLSPEKGQHHVVAAAPAILKAAPSTRFVLIGDEDPSHHGYSEQLRGMLRNQGCESAFVFAGFQADMKAAYQAVDIVAFPTASEGFGRVVIEAGALSKPVVATALPVLHEIIPSGLAADLLAPPEEFAARLSRLIADPRFRDETGNRLCEHVRSRFTLEAHTRQLSTFYERVTRGSGG